MNLFFYRLRLYLIVISSISFLACTSGNHTICSSLPSNDTLIDGSNDTATIYNIIQVIRNCQTKNYHYKLGCYVSRSPKYEKLTFPENHNVDFARNNCDFEEWISICDSKVDTIYILEQVSPKYVCMWWNNNWSVTIREYDENQDEVSLQRYYLVSAMPFLNDKNRNDFLLKQRIMNWNLDELAQMRTPRHVKDEMQYYLLTRLIVNLGHISQCEWIRMYTRFVE